MADPSTSRNSNKVNDNDTVDNLIESCKPNKKRGRPSYKRQLGEIRDEHKVNLQTAESIVAITNLKSILSLEAFESLPENCKSQLVKLLPDVDQFVDTQSGSRKPSDTSLNNEHFAKFCDNFTERLAKSLLKPEAIEKRKSETQKELCKLDPWKLKNYEPIWGQKLVSHSFHDLNSKGFEKVVSNAFKDRRTTKRVKKRIKGKQNAKQPQQQEHPKQTIIKTRTSTTMTRARTKEAAASAFKSIVADN